MDWFSVQRVYDIRNTIQWKDSHANPSLHVIGSFNYPMHY